MLAVFYLIFVLQLTNPSTGFKLSSIHSDHHGKIKPPDLPPKHSHNHDKTKHPDNPANHSHHHENTKLQDIPPSHSHHHENPKLSDVHPKYSHQHENPKVPNVHPNHSHHHEKLKLPDLPKQLCYMPPKIKNADYVKMLTCINTQINKHCELQCKNGYKPTKSHVRCIQSLPLDSKYAGWDTANARCETEIVCKDNQNQPIDWFILYKQMGNENNISDYVLITEKYSEHIHDGFTTKGSAPCLNHTLAPLDEKKVTYAVYGDFPPTTASPGAIYGHAKGVVARRDDRGFFITHSLPHFPTVGSLHGLSAWNQKKAQLFMCISFNAQIYWKNVVGYVNSLHPFIYDVSDDLDRDTDTPFSLLKFLSFDLKSLNGEKFRLLSKSDWGVSGRKDIFEHVIVPYYDVKLLVASWRNGPWDKIYVSCTKDGVVDDVIGLEYKDGDEVITWDHGEDHSKWAVSIPGGLDVFCISDLNRVYSQKKRYGGAVCMDGNMDVVEWFRNIISMTECQQRLQGELAEEAENADIGENDEDDQLSNLRENESEDKQGSEFQQFVDSVSKHIKP